MKQILIVVVSFVLTIFICLSFCSDGFKTYLTDGVSQELTDVQGKPYIHTLVWIDMEIVWSSLDTYTAKNVDSLSKEKKAQAERIYAVSQNLNQ